MLEVASVYKTFDGEQQRKRRKRAVDAEEGARVFAVNDVSFTVEDGDLFTLLGPSGCGKTTTLRSIAGLETPDSGTIRIGDRVLFSGQGGRRATVNVPVNKRGLGMVFQSYAIWPHMSVFDNVAFPLQVMPRGKRPSKSEIVERVNRVLETMELRKYAERHATKLSGGQQQRLALARAIVIEPELLLLDEPLSNLDAKLRESLRFELKRLQRELGITSIYVTHDQTEALALSTKIAVMSQGHIIQLGRPREIYEKPETKFVAEFIGTANFVDGVVRSRDGENYVVETTEGRLSLTAAAPIPTGSEVVASIRPESVEILVDEPTDNGNVWRGTVTTRAFLGDAVDHVVAVGKREVRVRCTPSTSVEPGSEVFLRLEPSKISLVPLD